MSARALSSLTPDRPHLEDYGSIEERMTEFVHHAHWLFRSGSESIHYHLDKNARNVLHASSTKPLQRDKNGREAFLAIVNQHSEKHK